AQCLRAQDSPLEETVVVLSMEQKRIPKSIKQLNDRIRRNRWETEEIEEKRKRRREEEDERDREKIENNILLIDSITRQ
ncbi:unnamed protein product, partial [Thlaspi arvense]